MNKIAVDKLKLTQHNLSLLAFLTQGSQEEFEFFLDHFWKGSSTQFFSIMKYRLYKIEQNKFDSYEEFCESYVVNPCLTLERMFQHPISQEDVRRLSELLENGFTLKELFFKNRSNPKYPLSRYLT